MKKEKTIYYQNEQEDFAQNNIKHKKISDDFDYQNDKLPYKLAGFTLYHIIAKPIVNVIMKITHGGKIVNKKLIKKYHKTGLFIYGNHTGGMIDAFQPNRLRIEKNYIICNSDAISIPGLKNIVMMLGAIPIGESYNVQKKFSTTVDNYIKKNKSITIYPEAHIWPYYTNIRNFSSKSFSYPIKLNVPSFAMTTTYQKRRFRKKPKVTTFIDGPFYPDENLPLKEAKEKLRDQIYNAMKIRVDNFSTYSYYNYVEKKSTKKQNL